MIPDPMLNLRGNQTSGMSPNMSDSLIPKSTGPSTPTIGICNEDVRVPDKMVGLSKSRLL